MPTIKYHELNAPGTHIIGDTMVSIGGVVFNTREDLKRFPDVIHLTKVKTGRFTKRIGK